MWVYVSVVDGCVCVWTCGCASTCGHRPLGDGPSSAMSDQGGRGWGQVPELGAESPSYHTTGVRPFLATPSEAVSSVGTWGFGVGSSVWEQPRPLPGASD